MRVPSRRRRRSTRPALSYERILAWADQHHTRTGRWPGQQSGPVIAAPHETWLRIASAMYKGHRGLRTGYSLAQLLADRRGVRNIQNLPRYSEAAIVTWADRHFQRIGRWPRHKSGRVIGAHGESWLAVDTALREGGRGLPGGSSLARLLARDRGVPNLRARPRLTVAGILRWADRHRRRTGKWPKLTSGPIVDAPGETWSAIQRDLVVGCRGLPGNSSLPQLLARHRGARNRLRLTRLSTTRILKWADAHRQQTGQYPTAHSGPVRQSPGETWAGVNGAMVHGRRGLSRSSLAQLLAERRGVRYRRLAPPLRIRQILAWADDHHRRTGAWPKATSGPVAAGPGETWTAVEMALRKRSRGLPGGCTLHRLLRTRRRIAPGVRRLE